MINLLDYILDLFRDESHAQAFVANPAEIDRYRADEAIRPIAVEEVLRWATPVAFWTRSTKVDIEMDGITIPKGDRVVSMLRSANRDEEVFGDPFTFDIGRTDNPRCPNGEDPCPAIPLLFTISRFRGSILTSVLSFGSATQM